MQNEQMPLAHRIIWTLGTLLLLLLLVVQFIFKSLNVVIIGRLTVERMIVGIVLWLACLYLVLLKPDKRLAALAQFGWWAVNWTIWFVLITFPLFFVIFLLGIR